MVDVVQEPRTIDVAEELKDRFLGSYWWYLEGMEFRPGFRLTKKEAALADVFERLHDSVDAIPERLTAQIADVIDKVLQPEGVAVVIKATHGCMTSRDVHKHGAAMVTSRMLGCFRDNPATRHEFMTGLNI